MMTLDQFIATYTGKRVGDGECGTLVRRYWIDVDHTNPPSYPDSKDYWFNPVPGYDKVSTPLPGDIAIYNGHGAYPEGHSAIYYDGRVFEQNADPDGSPAHLYKKNSPYLLGYLRKQGAIMPAIKGAPASVSWGAQRLDEFVCGEDNKLYHRWYDSGKWGDWENVTDKYLVGLVTPELSATSWGQGRIDISFTGSAGDLVHIWYTDGKFQGPESLGTPK